MEEEVERESEEEEVMALLGLFVAVSGNQAYFLSTSPACRLASQQGVYLKRPSLRGVLDAVASHRAALRLHEPLSRPSLLLCAKCLTNWEWQLS